MVAPASAPRPTVQDLLDRERRQPPPHLREIAASDLGGADIPVARYIDPAFAALEADAVWARQWQLACRLEDIPERGDHILYDVGAFSFIVVRVDERTVRAYRNACLHRGRALRDEGGCVQAFTCPFHGFAWRLDGRLAFVPAAWDFPDLDREAWRLPEAQVGVWAGFVFINPDRTASPLAEHLHGLDAHFLKYDLGSRYKAVHVEKVIPANWKVVAEAFIESFHVWTTHASAASYIGDANSQYDVWPERNWNRMIVPRGLTSPMMPAATPKAIVAASPDFAGRTPPALAAGDDPRRVIADARRATLAQQFGVDPNDVSDCEAIDTIQYFIFPNMALWQAWGSFIVYRWRPDGDSADRSLMDVMFVVPWGDKPRPRASAPTKLGVEESWHGAPQLGGYCAVFEEDSGNLAALQKGLKATAKPGVTLAHYQESRIRHLHLLLDRAIAAAAPDPRPAAL